MANMTFKANLLPDTATRDLGSSTASSQRWNIYAETVTLSQDPVNAFEAATKQYVDNSKSYEIKIKSTSSTYSIVTDFTTGTAIPQTETMAQEIYNNAKDCIINSSDYGYVEANCTFGSNSSYGGAYVRIFGKAYYSVLYYELQQYKIFEIFAAPKRTSGNKIILTVYDGEDELENAAYTVEQKHSTDNQSYPLLMSSTTVNNTDNGYYYTIRNKQIYGNPNTGTISAKSLVITDTASTARVEFVRSGTAAPSYIQFPPNSRLNFVGNTTRNTGNSMMILESIEGNPSIFPGTTNQVNLGTTSNKWKNVRATTLNGDKLVVGTASYGTSINDAPADPAVGQLYFVYNAGQVR